MFLLLEIKLLSIIHFIDKISLKEKVVYHQLPAAVSRCKRGV